MIFNLFKDDAFKKQELAIAKNKILSIATWGPTAMNPGNFS